MTPEQFTYWLQGWTELSGATPTEEQWKSIKEHLQTVFKKVTPPISVPTPNVPYIDWNQPPTPYPYDFPKTGDKFDRPIEMIC